MGSVKSGGPRELQANTAVDFHGSHMRLACLDTRVLHLLHSFIYSVAFIYILHWIPTSPFDLRSHQP